MMASNPCTLHTRQRTKQQSYSHLGTSNACPCRIHGKPINSVKTATRCHAFDSAVDSFRWVFSELSGGSPNHPNVEVIPREPIMLEDVLEFIGGPPRPRSSCFANELLCSLSGR